MTCKTTLYEVSIMNDNQVLELARKHANSTWENNLARDVVEYRVRQLDDRLIPRPAKKAKPKPKLKQQKKKTTTSIWSWLRIF